MIEDIILHKPFSVSFRHDGQRYVYLIDAGGLRKAGGDIHHETPTGSINLSCSTFAEVAIAAQELGARLSTIPHVREAASPLTRPELGANPSASDASIPDRSRNG